MVPSRIWLKLRIRYQIKRFVGFQTTTKCHRINYIHCNTLHNWPRCPEGDFRPEAILSTSFGTSRTASHRSVTLYKASESSDLDFWLDSTPFWCKNRFCSFKTEGVTNIFVLLTKNIWWHQARYVGERSSGCECYSWRLIPAHTLQHCTVGAQWARILTK